MHIDIPDADSKKGIAIDEVQSFLVGCNKRLSQSPQGLQHNAMLMKLPQCDLTDNKWMSPDFS
jgi:hypothetical protein